MSRIGRKPVVVPEKVNVKVADGAVFVEGPLGKLSFKLPDGILAVVKDKNVNLTVAGGAVGKAALYGTIRARVNNMVNGVSSGFSKVLEISGVGFKGAVTGNKLSMQLGFSHPVLMDIPPGIKMAFDPKAVILTISGADKDLVGNLAAQIKRVKPPEPYKGTGIKYQGEHIIRKAGKTAAGAASGAVGGAAKK